MVQVSKAIGKSILGGGIGLFLLIIGTAMHQTKSNEFPVGLVAAGLLLLVAGQNLRDSRISSWSFTIAFSIGMFLIALASNQDAMLPANELGFAWSYGAIGLSFVISAWPRLKSRA